MGISVQKKLENNIENIKKLYLESKYTFADIGREYNVAGGTIKIFLVKQGIYDLEFSKKSLLQNQKIINNRINQNNIKHYPLLLDFQNPESAYWIGFLCADGWVAESKIGLTLGIVDIDHLYKIKTFLGLSNQITLRHQKERMLNGKTIIAGDYCGIMFRSKSCVEEFCKIGLTPKKSLTLNITEPILLNSRDFWRGFIDGNGSISIAYNNRKEHYYCDINIAGSYHMIEKYIEYVKNNISFTLSKPIKAGNTYQTSFTYKKGFAVLQHFYMDNIISLNRKQTKYEEVLKIFGKKYIKEEQI